MSILRIWAVVPTPVRYYPVAIRLRDRKGRAILCIALNPQSGDFSGAILEVPFKALLHVVNAMAKMTKADHSMVQERRISIIVIRANGRKERRKIVRCFKKCNCLLNKNLKTQSVSPTGSHCLRSNLSALNKEKNIMPRCADS